RAGGRGGDPGPVHPPLLGARVLAATRGRSGGLCTRPRRALHRDAPRRTRGQVPQVALRPSQENRPRPRLLTSVGPSPRARGAHRFTISHGHRDGTSICFVPMTMIIKAMPVVVRGVRQAVEGTPCTRGGRDRLLGEAGAGVKRAWDPRGV